MPNQDLCSYNQQQLWTYAQFKPKSTTYNLNICLHITTPVNIELIRKTVGIIVDRHEIMRTTYVEKPNGLYQVVHDRLEIPCTVYDGSKMSLAEIKEAAKSLPLKLYDLDKGSLVHLYFFTCTPTSTVFMLCLPHIIWDAWSDGVFFEEFSAIYSALSKKQPIPLAPLKKQYKELASWQNRFVRSELGQSQLQYWQRILSNPKPLELATARKAANPRIYEGDGVSFSLDNRLLAEVKAALISENGVTLNMYFLAAYLILLARYTKEEDVAIHIPLPGRLRVDPNRGKIDFSENIGYFVNPSVFRMLVKGDISFSEFLRRVRDHFNANRNNQDYPLLPLLRNADMQIPDIGYNFIRRRPDAKMDTLPLVFEMPTPWVVMLGDLRVEGLPIPQQLDLLDISFLLVDAEKDVFGALNFRTDVLDRRSAQFMVGHFQQILAEVVSKPWLPLNKISLLTPLERQKLLIEYNKTSHPYPNQDTIQGLFELQAARTPANIAVQFGDENLSYLELNNKADQIAYKLQQLGLGPNKIVGILCEQSLEIVVGIMGILKAGSAYLPIDAKYPASRIQYMLQDSGATVLLTHSNLKKGLSSIKYAGTVIDLEDKELYQQVRRPARSCYYFDLAYLIYTSGSTGQPKGAMLSHRNVLNYLSWAIEYYQLHKGCGAPLHSSIAFDLTVTSLFTPLLSGRTVHVTPVGIDGLVAVLEKEQNFSLIKITPAHLKLLQHSLSAEVIRKLTGVIVIGGEALLGEHIHFLRKLNPRLRFVNEYGPTETAVGCCIEEVDEHAPERGPLPIGLPIANTELYVLDEALQPLPEGVIGELYIGGDSVGLGYIHRPELTKEKFIPNPFGRGFVYKTGDMVKWNSRGVLEYLGRNDFQVKIHGYRIELGEIESFIAGFEQVKEVVTLVREDLPNQKQLVAYIVLKDEKISVEKAEVIFNQIRQRMQAQLPSYMVPAHWISIRATPLNINGKVERKLLPVPTLSNQQLGTMVVPKDITEQKLLAIWCRIFNFASVSTAANFFELGGSSITAVLMLSAVEEAFGKKVLIREFLQAPTIQGIAEFLEDKLKLAPTKHEEADKFMQDIKLLDSLKFPIQLSSLSQTPKSIFFTGASGFLGAYLLFELLQQYKTAQVFCLIRAKSTSEGSKRLQETLSERHLWQAHFGSRIVPVIGDISQPMFGMTESNFAKLAKEIDVIFHNAAIINYIATYEMHRSSNVLGTLTIIQLAIHQKLKPIHFISTTSVFDSLAFTSKATVNESTALVMPEKLSGGYAQSKWVADRLIEGARERGVPVTIYRPAGIAGDQKYKKGKDDFFHRFYAGIAQFGFIPDTKSYTDMMPVDFLGRAIILLSMQKDSIGKNYHFNCPSPMPASAFVGIMKTLGFKLQPIPFKDWRIKFSEYIRLHPENPLYPISPLLVEDRAEGITVHEMYAEPLIPKYDSQRTMQKLQALGLDPPSMDEAFYQDYIRVILETEKAEKMNIASASQGKGYYPSKALGGQSVAAKGKQIDRAVNLRASL